MRALALLALLLTLPGAIAAADAPRHGLMWNRSGLPATFPLQVRTRPGPDWVVELRDADDGTPVLAAYIEGGRFFRVLVPPGSFTLHFAAGTEWQDEGALFGPDTVTLDIAGIYRFGVRGLGTKSGHLVDLRGEAPGVLALNERSVRPDDCLAVAASPAPPAPPRQPAPIVVTSLAEAVGAGHNPVPLPGEAGPDATGWVGGDIAGLPGFPWRDAPRGPGFPYRDVGTATPAPLPASLPDLSDTERPAFPQSATRQALQC